MMGERNLTDLEGHKFCVHCMMGQASAMPVAPCADEALLGDVLTNV